MIEKYLMKGEEIKHNLKNQVFITNKRVLQYKKNWLKESFKDISHKYLQSITQSNQRFILLLIIGVIGLGATVTPNSSLTFFGSVVGAVFILMFIFMKQNILIFEGINTKISVMDDTAKLKEIREIYETYNK